MLYFKSRLKKRWSRRSQGWGSLLHFVQTQNISRFFGTFYYKKASDFWYFFSEIPCRCSLAAISPILQPISPTNTLLLLLWLGQRDNLSTIFCRIRIPSKICGQVQYLLYLNWFLVWYDQIRSARFPLFVWVSAFQRDLGFPVSSESSFLLL